MSESSIHSFIHSCLVHWTSRALRSHAECIGEWGSVGKNNYCCGELLCVCIFSLALPIILLRLCCAIKLTWECLLCIELQLCRWTGSRQFLFDFIFRKYVLDNFLFFSHYFLSLSSRRCVMNVIQSNVCIAKKVKTAVILIASNSKQFVCACSQCERNEKC